MKNKICSKKQCNRPAKNKLALGVYYCYKHYRLYQMRKNARQRDKYVPTWEELENLFVKFAKNMQCYRCNKQMIWHSVEKSRSDVITLQHNNNGSIEVCCHTCNVRHGASKLGDKYWDIPKDHKYCPNCTKIILKLKFGKNKARSDNLNSICKKCSRKRAKDRYQLKKSNII